MSRRLFTGSAGCSELLSSATVLPLFVVGSNLFLTDKILLNQTTSDFEARGLSQKSPGGR